MKGRTRSSEPSTPNIWRCGNETVLSRSACTPIHGFQQDLSTLDFGEGGILTDKSSSFVVIPLSVNAKGTLENGARRRRGSRK